MPPFVSFGFITGSHRAGSKEKDSYDELDIPGLPDENTVSQTLTDEFEEERCSSMVPSSSKPKKSVRFAEYASVHIYRRRCLEGTSTWYSVEELKAFRMDAVSTIHRIVAGEASPSCEDGSVEHCSRGCESRTPLGSTVRQRHRNESLQAVFRFQDECRRQLRLKRGRAAITKQIPQQDVDVDNSKNNRHLQHGASIRLADIMDPNKLAEVYSRCTQQSKQSAQFIGQMDRMSVCRWQNVTIES
ncbi:hypothetical protein IV203_030521 [Nitzschia inconspicua]|uniref:Uncharacterized protein n=1 Tax=Nitzschia inconspicua TaxID=303405 RepID=A0A9K3LSJ8_9STRA|nr:hypothetical protein IV203_030521 [Nitzschia inconspicua]